MTNEQIFGILGQGLDIATQKGVFNLSDAKVVADALIQLKEVLNIKEKEDDSIKAE
jgi:hypothetical protein